MDALDTKVDALDTKVDALDTKVNALDTKVQGVDADMQEIRRQVIKTNVIIENEIRVNIQRIAEGHLDLSRNLHEAMRPSNEVEMLAIKVRMLESDVKELKARLA
ncbi:MAG: hypothetical protein NC123_00985 [Butyrivibrio sp.]|nr:hypothetical protein [Acetatifactor muris]MCM1558110.1 hypothetical protein [Butyrivibrio sp.]